MCGAIQIAWQDDYDDSLSSWYTEEHRSQWRSQGIITFAFWDKVPVLPFHSEGGTQFLIWGNRDKKLSLPPSGWARYESLKGGRWDYLHPDPVRIPALRGYEKNVWFPLGVDIRGIVVEYRGHSRIYMITTKAEAHYFQLTNHSRMPLLLEPVVFNPPQPDLFFNNE